ncbi:hypothetical protein CEP51_016326, partial [Fusarium floridanum]
MADAVDLTQCAEHTEQSYCFLDSVIAGKVDLDSLQACLEDIFSGGTDVHAYGSFSELGDGEVRRFTVLVRHGSARGRQALKTRLIESLATASPAGVHCFSLSCFDCCSVTDVESDRQAFAWYDTRRRVIEDRVGAMVFGTRKVVFSDDDRCSD